MLSLIVFFDRNELVYCCGTELELCDSAEEELLLLLEAELLDELLLSG